MYRKIIVILWGTLLWFSTGAWSQTQEINKAAWLLGTWELKTKESTFYETWAKESDSVFKGKSYTLEGKDTVVLEVIQLVQESEGLFYIPAVKDQNEGMPVYFKASALTAKEMVFDNPKHDFPQKISYRQISSDSMIAVISGKINGQNQSREFPMKRTRK